MTHRNMGEEKHHLNLPTDVTGIVIVRRFMSRLSVKKFQNNFSVIKCILKVSKATSPQPPPPENFRRDMSSCLPGSWSLDLYIIK